MPIHQKQICGKPVNQVTFNIENRQHRIHNNNIQYYTQHNINI